MDTFILLKDVIQSSWEEAGKPERVLVAFSGGADSTALLVALHRFSAENGGIPFIAAHHVHHGLRNHADLDADFCERMCSQLSIPYSCTRIHLNGKSEDEARTLRYEALVQAADYADISTIALAHHLHDQTETMLMRLIRGTADGLKGMSVFSHRHDGTMLWRPFLSLSPELLKASLFQANIPWREDESNLDTFYLRNYLRNEVLPLLRNASSHLDEHFYQASITLQEESAFLHILADEFLKNHASTLLPCPFLDTSAFSALHPAMKKRVLHTFFRLAGHFSQSPDRSMYEACAAIQPNRTVNLPEDRRLFHAGTRIHLIVPEAASTLGELVILPFETGASNGIDTQCIPKSVFEGAILRFRQPGDYIVPFGMEGRKTLQDYLTDRKVDRPFRDHLPLLCNGQEVLWVIGVGASEKMRARLDDPATNLLLQYSGRLIMRTSQHLSIQDISTKEH